MTPTVDFILYTRARLFDYSWIYSPAAGIPRGLESFILDLPVPDTGTTVAFACRQEHACLSLVRVSAHRRDDRARPIKERAAAIWETDLEITYGELPGLLLKLQAAMDQAVSSIPDDDYRVPKTSGVVARDNALLDLQPSQGLISPAALAQSPYSILVPLEAKLEDVVVLLHQETIRDPAITILLGSSVGDGGRAAVYTTPTVAQTCGFDGHQAISLTSLAEKLVQPQTRRPASAEASPARSISNRERAPIPEKALDEAIFVRAQEPRDRPRRLFHDLMNRTRELDDLVVRVLGIVTMDVGCIDTPLATAWVNLGREIMAFGISEDRDLRRDYSNRAVRLLEITRRRSPRLISEIERIASRIVELLSAEKR